MVYDESLNRAIKVRKVWQKKTTERSVVSNKTLDRAIEGLTWYEDRVTKKACGMVYEESLNRAIKGRKVWQKKKTKKQQGEAW